MQAVDLSKPGERKKLIWAAILGVAALIVLWWVLFGFGGSSPRTTPRATATPTPVRNAQPGTQQQAAQTVSPNVADLAMFAPIKYVPSSYSAPEATRNIFAYYVPPKPAPTIAQEPTPVPKPPAPVLLASLSPANVYARSADFKLEASGDKFTPSTKIYFDGRELQTTYISPQQLSANVSAALIAAPGTRTIIVRNADNSLFSDPANLNVAAPPTPNYLYVGIISPQNRAEDVAIVQDKSDKNKIMNVHRGDLLSGRFRVTSISDKELVMTDTTLRIPHKIAMSEAEKSFGNPLTRPTPRVESEDDEP
jgi:hypothetical protein